MRVWAVCVLVLFSAVELYQWGQRLTVPLPIYGAAGLLLAILSNADQLPWLKFTPPSASLNPRSRTGSVLPIDAGATYGEPPSSVSSPSISSPSVSSPAMGNSTAIAQSIESGLHQPGSETASGAAPDTAPALPLSESRIEPQLPSFSSRSAPISFTIQRERRREGED